MVISKYIQLNTIPDVWEPKYSTNEVYIACHKVNRSKLDIKLRFSKVNPTSEYYGDWFITRKKARSYRKRYDNNGKQCYAIPMSVFEKLTITNEMPEAARW